MPSTRTGSRIRSAYPGGVLFERRLREGIADGSIAVADRPDTAARELALVLGVETLVFKRRVRSLKELGLTLSQPVGYRLSPRGSAYRRLSTRR